MNPGPSVVIAVILALCLHHGNGRAVTSTNNDNIERILDLVVEELNTVLNETNENSTEREENPADVLKFSEPDSLSYELLQSQFSSNNMIQPEGASPALRQKRSHVGACYSGKYDVVKLASGEVKRFPICKKVSFFCSPTLSNKNYKRLCVASFTTVLFQGDDGTYQLGVFAKSCACAA